MKTTLNENNWPTYYVWYQTKERYFLAGIEFRKNFNALARTKIYRTIKNAFDNDANVIAFGATYDKNDFEVLAAKYNIKTR